MQNIYFGLRINQRCNLAIDCPDKSDEKVIFVLKNYFFLSFSEEQ